MLGAIGALCLLVPANSLYRDGYEVIETGPGGFFGAVLDETTGTAWFGIDDAPTRVVRIDLNTMAVTGKLELNADEQRLWCFVKHGNFGYLGVEAPGGRLVGRLYSRMNLRCEASSGSSFCRSSVLPPSTQSASRPMTSMAPA